MRQKFYYFWNTVYQYLPVRKIRVIFFQGFEPIKNADKGHIFQNDDWVKNGRSVPRFSIFDIEKAETINDTHDSVVQPFFPSIFAKVGVLPDHPGGHDQPMDN